MTDDHPKTDLDNDNLSFHEVQDKCDTPLLKQQKYSSMNATLQTQVFTEDECINETEKFTNEIMESLQCVLNAVKRAGHLETWVKLHRSSKNGTFPFNTIPFLLFMDVVRFLDNANSSSMRYSEAMKKFCRIGYRLFHGSG